MPVRDMQLALESSQRQTGQFKSSANFKTSLKSLAAAVPQWIRLKTVAGKEYISLVNRTQMPAITEAIKAFFGHTTEPIRQQELTQASLLALEPVQPLVMAPMTVAAGPVGCMDEALSPVGELGGFDSMLGKRKRPEPTSMEALLSSLDRLSLCEKKGADTVKQLYSEMHPSRMLETDIASVSDPNSNEVTEMMSVASDSEDVFFDIKSCSADDSMSIRSKCKSIKQEKRRTDFWKEQCAWTNPLSKQIDDACMYLCSTENIQGALRFKSITKDNLVIVEKRDGGVNIEHDLAIGYQGEEANMWASQAVVQSQLAQI